MPANLSARAFLWIGLGLLLAGALAQAAVDLVFRTIGPDSLQVLADAWWFSALDVIRAVLVPLGPLMLAAYFVARMIEYRLGTPTTPAPRNTAGWVFGAGILLILFGVLLGGSLDGWLMTLNAQGRTSLALDLLNLVVVPLRTLVFPLGLALLPASALMKKLQDSPGVTAPAGQLPR